MGQFGKTFIGTSLAQTIPVLLRAYADEWFAHYNYQMVAHTLRGHHSPATVDLLLQKSAVALERANRLCNRLLELGERSIPKLRELEKISSNKPFKLPKRMDEVDVVLKAVLDADRTSIRTFMELLEISKDKDPLSERLAATFLQDAVAAEEQIERLLGDAAPEMTGK